MDRLNRILGHLKNGETDNTEHIMASGIAIENAVDKVAKFAVDKVAKFELFKVPPRWVFLRLETENGIVGWGEPNCEGYSDTVMAAVKQLMELVIGEDPARIQYIWQKVYRQKFYSTGGGPIIMSALAGRPSPHPYLDFEPILIIITVIIFDIAVIISCFKLIKMNACPKMPFVDTELAVERAAKRLKAVREAVGPDVGIGLDFHGRVKVPTAKKLMKALEPYNPLFFEEPVVPEQNAALKSLSAATHIPIATGERMYTAGEFRDLLSARSAHILQPDCSHVGGISALFQISRMAEAYDVAMAPHCPLGPIALAACIQVDACAANFAFQETSIGIHYNKEGGSDEVKTGRCSLLRFVKNPEIFDVDKDGCMRTPSGYGLGVQIDESEVRRAAAKGHDYKDREWTLQDGTPTRCNATKEADVLVLGDGNFSFSRAYAKRYPHHRVVATSVDTKDALREKYREFDRIVSKLEDLGVQIQLMYTSAQLHVTITRFDYLKLIANAVKHAHTLFLSASNFTCLPQYEVDATDVQGTLQETLHTPSSSCGRSFSSATTLTATEATKNPIPSSRRSQPHSASTQLFDLIIFNFPHLGVEDLQAHRPMDGSYANRPFEQEVELCREIMDIPVAKAAYASPDDHRDAMRRRGSEKKRLLSAIRTRLEIAEGEGRSLHWKDKHLWRFLQEQRYSEKSRYDRRNNDQELKEVGHHEQQRDRKRKREILEETGDTRIREESAAAPVLVAGSQEEKRANDEDEKTTTTTTTQIMASLEEKEEGRPHRTIARKPQTIASMLPSPPKGSGVYKTTNSQPQQQQQQQQSQQERPYCRVCDLAFQSREEWRMHLSMLRPR
eukprot:jgi/Bigna1/132571/aug1.18_g7279